MQRLTIIRTPGDPEQLLAIKRQHIDPVMERKGGGYGHIFHVAAKGPDGMIVVNLWDSAEGSEQAAQDPEIQQAREAMRESGAATRQPEFSHYEVVDYRQSSGG
jgi:hypothetical protein